jgi:predicted AAA+ superfamily ATPase
VRTIEVPPLQPDEYLGAQLKTEVAANPVLGASAEPTPTNSVIVDPHQHWLRGGIPESLQAESAAASLVWRRNMIDDLLARDYRDFDVPAASRLRDLLLWIANQNCGEFDEDGFSLMKRAEMRSALYVLEQIGIVRRLSNFPADSNLSFAKKPKLYIRDSGILHATLGIETVDQLRARRDIGSSWEGYATEALIEASQGRATYQFYRAEGEEGEDEIDLVLAFTSASVIAGIEFKTSPAAKPRPGFFRACSAIDARERFVVHSGDVAQSDEGIPRLDLLTAIGRVRGLAQS